MAAALGIPVEAYADALKRTWSERARGELGDLPSTLRRLASACGADPTDAELDEACEARRDEQLRHVRLRESAVPMLRTLKERGFRTGLVSDCTHEVPEVWSSLPVAPYIDRPVFSVEAGLKKPDPAIFRLVAEWLEVRPEDCLYEIFSGGPGVVPPSMEPSVTATAASFPERPMSAWCRCAC